MPPSDDTSSSRRGTIRIQSDVRFVLHAALDGPRLRLRPLEHGDFAAWLEMRQDPDVGRFVSTPLLGERATHAEDRFFDEMEASSRGDNAVLAACRLDSGRVVGQCMLQAYELSEYDEPTAELIVVIRADSRGQGFGREAARLAIAMAWTLDQIMRVVGRVDRRNQQSQRMVADLGMLHAGIARGWNPAGPVDVFVIARPLA